MSLTAAVVEDAALSWFEELGYTVDHEPEIDPGETNAERSSFGDVALVGRLREAIHRDAHSFRNELRPSIVGRQHGRLSGKLPSFEKSAGSMHEVVCGRFFQVTLLKARLDGARPLHCHSGVSNACEARWTKRDQND